MIPYLRCERRWRDAVCCAVLPPSEDGRFPGLAAVDLARFWERFERAAPVVLRLGLRVAVWELALLPLFRLGGVRPRLFPDLPDDEKDALLRACCRSRLYLLRQSVLLVKLAACFAAFADAGVRSPFKHDAGLPPAGGQP